MFLITGGAGFIGSALIHHLNLNGITNIVLVDQFGDTQKWKNVSSLKFEEFINFNELFDDKYVGLLNRVKVIFHLGAISTTTEKNVDLIWQNNVIFSQKLFNFATYSNIPILYASSGATYGNGEFGYSDDHELIPKLRPLNPYGFSKQFFDQWVLRQKRRPDRWFGFKFFNVYGPNEYHKGSMRSVVIQAYEQISKESKVRLFKSYKEEFQDGEQLRDFIYVKDVTRALWDFFNLANKEHSGIYNLGNGKSRSFNQLANAVFKTLYRPVKIDYIEMPADLINQYQYLTEAKMEKFYKVLPTFKFTDLEAGIEDYINNFLIKADPYLV